MSLDISKVPFSMRGAYMAVSYFPAEYRGSTNEEGVYFRTIHGLTYIPNSTMGTCLPYTAQIIPTWQGERIHYQVHAEETQMSFDTEHGQIQVCFADTDTLLFKGSGNGIGMRLRLIDGDYAYEVGAGNQTHIMLNCAVNSRRFLMRVQTGSVSPVTGYCQEICLNAEEDGSFLVGIEDIVEEWNLQEREYSFAESLHEREKEFETFLKGLSDVSGKYADACRNAAYVNWSGVVKKAGLLTRETMLMAKNWMCNVWSWDHCFNAIASAYTDPKLAWDQFMVMFDLQQENGRIPDCVSDSYAIWNFVKPPVHGWALARLEEIMEISRQQYEEAYEHLTKWTNWWLTYRDSDGDGICEYHHGNDSGWDNSTAFRVSPAMELPDLAAFLIIQMDKLEDVAFRLGKKEEAKAWRKRSDKMLSDMLTHCFDGVRPRALVSRSHEEVENDSLIMYLSLLLGEKLPKNIRESMIRELKTRKFLTEHGLSTEAVDSEYYVSDGYWRGPIWAPSTMLLYDGLRKCGEEAFAAELAEKYCDMAAVNGFAENYDALTGEGLRDKAYTWTSSVFLILAHEIMKLD